MSTCTRCFDGRHIRCEDRQACTCSICSDTRPSWVAPPKPKPSFSPGLQREKERKTIKWTGEKKSNNRTLEQQTYYNKQQRLRRQRLRGDPTWLLDPAVLVEKINGVFDRLEEQHLADIQSE